MSERNEQYPVSYRDSEQYFSFVWMCVGVCVSEPDSGQTISLSVWINFNELVLTGFWV